MLNVLERDPAVALPNLAEMAVKKLGGYGIKNVFPDVHDNVSRVVDASVEPGEERLETHIAHDEHERGRLALEAYRKRRQELDDYERLLMLESAHRWPTPWDVVDTLVEDNRGYGIVVPEEVARKLGGALWELPDYSRDLGPLDY